MLGAKTGMRLRARDALAALLLVALGAGLLLPGLGGMGAVFSTDARYLEIAREMVTTGDLAMPKLAGAPHLDKPPLAYWASAAGYALFGVGPFGGRFFQQVALIGTLLLLFGYGRRWLSTGAALLGPLVLLSAALPFGASRGLSTDFFQLFFLTGALLALLDGSLGRAPRANLLFGMAMLGGSMLAKGPIASLVLLAIWAPYRWLGGPRLDVSRGTRWLGAALFLGIGSSWYLWLLHGNAELLRYLVEDQLLGRLGAEGLGHPHGPGYIVAAWLWGTLPWTPLLIAALWRLRPARRLAQRDPLELFLWLWALVPVVFFSIPATKLPSYVLPAFPGGALLLARAADTGRLLGRDARVGLRAAYALAGVIATALGAALLHPTLLSPLVSRIELDTLHQGRDALGFALLGLAGLLGMLAVFVRRAGTRPLLALGATMAATLCLGFVGLGPSFRSHERPGALAAAVPGARVICMGRFQPSLLFYFGAVDRTYVEGTPEAPGGLAEPARTSVSEQQAVAMMEETAPTFAFVDKRRSQEAFSLLGGRAVWCDRRYCLLANQSALEALGRERRHFDETLAGLSLLPTS